MEGQAETAPTPLLTDGDAAKGYVLACQSKITGNVSVRIPEEVLARKLKIELILTVLRSTAATSETFPAACRGEGSMEKRRQR